MEGKSDVTIGIRIRFAYVRNYALVVQLMFLHILGCCCLFGEPAASRVVRVVLIISCSAGYDTWICVCGPKLYPVPQDTIRGL
eukprot:11036674-Ditylum_brightwellii.AAC.1